MADRIAVERCEFCDGTLVAVKQLKESYLVQCEDCGIITSSNSVVVYNNNNKMKKVRAMKRRFHD